MFKLSVSGNNNQFRPWLTTPLTLTRKSQNMKKRFTQSERKIFREIWRATAASVVAAASCVINFWQRLC